MDPVWHNTVMFNAALSVDVQQKLAAYSLLDVKCMLVGTTQSHRPLTHMPSSLCSITRTRQTTVLHPSCITALSNPHILSRSCSADKTVHAHHHTQQLQITEAPLDNNIVHRSNSTPPQTFLRHETPILKKPTYSYKHVQAEPSAGRLLKHCS